MRDAGDFAIGEDAPGGGGSRPVVVVQTRRGLLSRLTTPLLLLIAAGAVLSHRVKLDDWRGLFALAPAAPRRAAAPAEEPEPEGPRPAVVLAVPSPVVIKSRPGPAPRPSTRPRPAPWRPRGMPTVPPAGPLPDPGATASRAWEEIRRESERAEAEAAQLAALKAQAFAEDQRRAPALAVGEDPADWKNWRESHETRRAFHDELRRALAGASGHPARAVEQVCSERGVQVLVGRPSGTTTTGAAPVAGLTRAGRRDRVATLRRQGMAEAAILEDLARLEVRNRVARTGPKSREDILLRAARQLLEVPLGRGE